MTAKVPKIVITNQNTAKKSSQGRASKIAVIGAFPSHDNDPHLCASVEEANEIMGYDTGFKGCTVIEDLFTGASSLLIVNTVSWSTADPPVPTKTLDATRLGNALAKIKGEDWDLLFVADTLTDTLIPVIDAFLDSTYEIKFPAGYVGSIEGASTSDMVTTAGLAGDHCYGLITQTAKIYGKTKTLLQTAAYYCGMLAGMNVGKTMTMKVVPGFTEITPELSFETGGAGKTLLEAGITTFKYANRNAGKIIVVNSEQPNGLDLYMNRARDYVVKELSLHEFLGERNNEVTLDEIKHEIMRVKELCINGLDLLRDIEFEVVKKDTDTVDIHIQKLLFDGVITEIDVYVTVEVE